MIDILLRHLRRFLLVRQMIKFSVVGGTAALINFAIYFSLTHFAAVWYVYSAIVAYAVSAIFNFSANKIWTFRNLEAGKIAVGQAGRFGLVMGMGLLLNTGLIYFITDRHGVDYRISWFIATLLVAVWNFTINRCWTFRSRTIPIELS